VSRLECQLKAPGRYERLVPKSTKTPARLLAQVGNTVVRRLARLLRRPPRPTIADKTALNALVGRVIHRAGLGRGLLHAHDGINALCPSPIVLKPLAAGLLRPDRLLIAISLGTATTGKKWQKCNGEEHGCGRSFTNWKRTLSSKRIKDRPVPIV